MSRMDKYEENSGENLVLSRTQKNQDMYKDVYLNNTFVDYDELKGEEEQEEAIVTEMVIIEYEEKNYDINDYLKKAHENRVNDNVKRSLDDTDCEVNKVNDKEDEISKLIASIEEKENEQKETKFFDDLMPDNDNTVITDPVEETKLENVIKKEEIDNYQEEKEDNGEEDFKDILEEKRKSSNNKLPAIIFGITLVLLIIVVVLIFFII